MILYGLGVEIAVYVHMAIEKIEPHGVVLVGGSIFSFGKMGGFYWWGGALVEVIRY